MAVSRRRVPACSKSLLAPRERKGFRRYKNEIQVRFRRKNHRQRIRRKSSTLPFSNNNNNTERGIRIASSSEYPLFSGGSSGIVPENLLAWEGASRMYFWDSDNRCLHRISIRISINGNGSAVLLVGSNALCVMYLYGRPSPKDRAIICSLHKWESTFGLKSASSKAVSNSDTAISWLESTFPELARHAAEGRNKLELKAHPYARLDASITFQGPIRKLCHSEEEGLDIRASECEGRTISFLYNSVSKDSILVTAWSGGHLQIDTLGDELQPVLSFGNRPHVSVDSYDNIVGIAMSCESVSSELPVVTFDQLPDHNDWLGHPPPLLRLAIVDLALPKRDETG